MAGIDAFGTTLQRGNGASPEVFAEIANVTNIGGPGLSRETLDVTAHDSPNGWREHKGGLKDAGEISLDINFDPSEHDTLLADFADDEARNYKLVFPDGTDWALKAILTGFEASAPHDDKLTASISLKVTGKPNFSPS